MTTAVLADDEAIILHHLRRALAEVWPELDIVATANNGQSTVKEVLKHEPEVLFVDIRMPAPDGLEVASIINNEMSCPPVIVFLTAYDEYAVAAFEQNAVDYLLKPLDRDRLEDTVRRIEQRLLQKNDEQVEVLNAIKSLRGEQHFRRWLEVSDRAGVRMVNVADVIACVAEDKYTTVHTNRGEFLIRTSLRQLEEQLSPEMFRRVHRSALINLHWLDQVAPDEDNTLACTMTNGLQVAVSRRFASQFKPM